MAEGVFLRMLKEENLQHKVQVDAAGTGAWHVGELPDPRTREVCQAHGITLTSRARQFRASDFLEFDYILVADKQNYKDVEKLRPRTRHRSKLALICDYAPEQPIREVPDPYYGGKEGFENVYQLLDTCLRPLLNEIKSRLE